MRYTIGVNQQHCDTCTCPLAIDASRLRLTSNLIDASLSSSRPCSAVFHARRRAAPPARTISPRWTILFSLVKEPPDSRWPDLLNGTSVHVPTSSPCDKEFPTFFPTRPGRGLVSECHSLTPVGILKTRRSARSARRSPSPGRAWDQVEVDLVA